MQETKNIKEQCLKAYYYRDIEPSLIRLNEIKAIVKNFETQGASRLTCALNMKHLDLEEIETLGSYIAEAREKMEKELEYLRKFEKTFNGDFSTDHNDYYNSASEVLRHARSHMSPLKAIFAKFCTRKHPSASKCAAYGIESKSVFESSALGTDSYQLDLFDLSTYPLEAQGLFTEMIKFFQAEEEGLNICTNILEEEKEIANDPIKSLYVLDVYRRKAYKRLKNQFFLFTEDVVENLKAVNPAYQSYRTYASEEGFAQGEFHKQNRASMDHFFIIEICSEKNDITTEEKELWGNNPILVKKIRYVVSHFDEVLPIGFNHREMGLYEYIFGKWALPHNIKRATEYFIKNYNGKHKTTKYAGVSKNSSKYDKDSKMVKNFISAVNNLLLSSNDEDLVNNIA